MAERHLEEVDDLVKQQELMVNATSQVFDYYLSWTLAYLVDQANARLNDETDDARLPGRLALFVRFGVDDDRAIELLTSNVHSRRLALAIAADAAGVGVDVDHLRGWLAIQDPAVWTERYAASTTDLLELFDYSRDATAKVLRRLLDAETVRVDLQDLGGFEGSVEVAYLDAADGRSPVGLFAVITTELVARVPAEFQADLRNVHSAGVPLRASISEGSLLLTLDSDALE